MALHAASTLRQAIIAQTKGDAAVALRHWLDASWGALGAVLQLPGVGLQMLKPLFTGLRRSIVAPHGNAGRATVLNRSMKFDNQWASEPSQSLEEVTEDGIWKGTLRSVPSSVAPDIEHFVRDRGRLFKVIHDVEHSTLRVVKANRPQGFHQQAIVRTADGRWIPNSTGLRGGHAEDLGWITDLRQVSRGNGNPLAARGAFQGEAVVARFNPDIADNYLFSLNAQTCVVVSLYNPATRAGTDALAQQAIAIIEV
ncbi:hypothetical protein [Pseudomonas sp. UM16]|uniref:hypothetical protein n=1 Tax=Pseudomonas sp. UM16 TaxID=3158962 RepID=UPI00398F91F2